LSIDF
jgi:hypothetical protein